MFARLNNAEIYYEIHGDELAPAVVFVHGAGAAHLSWWQQVPRFMDRYRCIIFDQRGRGLSTDPGAEAAARFVDDLEALLDHLVIDRTAIVAQSIGGRAALGYTARHPDRVSALILCDTWGFLDSPKLWDLRERLADRRPAGPRRPGGVSPEFMQTNPAMVFLSQSLAAMGETRGIPDWSVDRGPSIEAVAAITTPTLFIRGSIDNPMPRELMRGTFELIDGAEWVDVEDSGHSVFWERPTEFNELLAASRKAPLASGDETSWSGLHTSAVVSRDQRTTSCEFISTAVIITHAMLSERIQRQIDALLDAADEGLRQV